MANGAAGAPPTTPPWWQVLLTSAGGAALITVLFGGLLGQWVNIVIQKHTTAREFNNAWLKARGDQALSAYRDYVTEQARVAEQLHGAIGSMVSASESLVASAYWKKNTTKERADVRSVALAFNSAENDWVKSQRRFGFLLSYYSNGNHELGGRWKSLVAAVDSYRQCVSTWYDQQHGKPDGPPEAVCSKEEAGIDQTLADLGSALETSRTYLWTGWDNPATLRHALAMN